MDSKIIEAFEDVKGKNFDAEWIYFPSKKHGFVAVVELGPDKWMVNDNGEMTEGDFATVLTKCIEIAKRGEDGVRVSNY